MSYTVFARKYRPQTFDDVIGQEHITTTLKNAIEQKRLAHAYIFVGPRGTGKTSTARIMAKALNCVNGPTLQPCGVCDACREIAAGTSLDVLEFDAASNTQVDKIRELIIDNVKYAPTRGTYKLYIVDEVHMLSTSSFNALLKTLEEPPAHVKFIFATTDPQKVPTTILSRCQRFDLKRIPTPLIAAHLLGIAAKEGIALSNGAADTVARGAEGGMRDAESMLDQLVAFCGNTIEEDDVLTIFGFTSRETVSGLCDHLIDADVPGALHLIHEQAEAGKDLSRLMNDLITHLRNLLVSKADPEGVKGDLGEEALAPLIEQGERLQMSQLLELIEQFAEAEARMKWAPNKKMHFEIAAIRAIQTLSQASLTDVLETLAALRDGKEIVRPEPRASNVPRPAKAATAPSKPKIAAPIKPPVESKPAPAPLPAVAAAPAPAPAPVPVVPAPVPAAPAVVEPAPKPAASPARSPEPVVKESKPAESKAAPKTVSAADAPQPDRELLWKKLLAEVRKERPLIAMWVEAGALIDLTTETAVLGFPSDASLAQEYCEQATNRKFLQDLASRLAGYPLKLRLQKKEGLVVEPVVAAKAEPARDPLEEFKDDPLIRKALEIFRAEIQPG
ncbi:MAG: DNA polymerase III subunit gamma/tau [Verrucomicrobiota bacterium]